jgi:hypothetical protein
MKKFLISFATLAMFCLSANANDAINKKDTASLATTNHSKTNTSSHKSNKSAGPKSDAKSNSHKWSDERRAKYQARKEAMVKRHQMIENLSPEQKAAVTKEKERHHNEMKKITNFPDEMLPKDDFFKGHHSKQTDKKKSSDKNTKKAKTKPTKSTAKTDNN